MPPNDSPLLPNALPDAQKSDTNESAVTQIFHRTDFLERLMGDEQIAGAVIDGFLADMPVLIAELQTAVAAGNIPLSEQHAHRIKGAAANLSCIALLRPDPRGVSSGRALNETTAE